MQPVVSTGTQCIGKLVPIRPQPVVSTGVQRNSEKAIKKAEEEQPDLILMDIRIKGAMDGIAAAEVIREQFDIPVIFSTAYADDERIERAKITMPFGYVLKPIQEIDLKVTIEMALYVVKVDARKRNVEEKLTLVMNGVRTPIVFIDSDLRYIFVNKAYTDWYNISKEDIEGKHIKDILAEDVFERALEKYQIALSGKNITFENKTVREGEEKFVFVELTPYYEEGIVKGFFSSITDITQRKRADEALQEGAFFFSQMFEQSTTSTCLYNPEGTIVKVNSEFCSMFGVEEEVITNGQYNILKDQAAIEAGIIPLVKEIFDEQKTNKWEFSFDVEMSSKSTETPTSKGGHILLEVFGYPILDSKGHLEHVALQHYDITERKRAEEARQLSETNLKRAQSLSKIGSWYYDQHNDTQVWSDECFKIFGYKKDDYPENIVPESIALSIYANPEETIKLETSLIEKHDTYDYEYNTVPINGKVKSIHTFCEVERDNEGNIYKIFGTDHDITERKQLEKQLIQAREQAEFANEVKSDFLSNISHELRTPMQGILGYSSLAIEKIDRLKKDKLLDYLFEIKVSGQRLMLLLNDILDLSKLESGMMEYKLIRVKMLEIMSIVINEFMVPAQKKEIPININKSEFNKTVIIDKDKMVQVFRNLIDNAIKFSNPNSEIQITIIKESDNFKISVIDQGIGIPEDELESVFDKFIQSSNTKTGAGGTGLGLAICKEIVEGHNGKIWAENNPEGGATFSFILPYEQKVTTG